MSALRFSCYDLFVCFSFEVFIFMMTKYIEQLVPLSHEE